MKLENVITGVDTFKVFHKIMLTTIQNVFERQCYYSTDSKFCD